jgi:hypothetical protein
MKSGYKLHVLSERGFKIQTVDLPQGETARVNFQIVVTSHDAELALRGRKAGVIKRRLTVEVENAD